MERSQAWYLEEIESLPEETREVFEKYSGIAPDEVEKHIYEVVRSLGAHSLTSQFV
jgi:hypothetical protein